MSSSIRLTSSGAPDTPPIGYARIYLDDYNGRLHLKMIRPDGSIEVFGTLNLPLDIENGGTGLQDMPGVGQFLIGTGDGYRIGDIIAGAGVNITKSATSFEISTDISNIDLQMPTEFSVSEVSINGQNTFVVTKTDQFANTVFAGPYNEDGTPTFRFLQVNDIPDLPITKIIDLIETIRAESLLVPTDSDDIDHTYDSVAKTLLSTIKPTTVTSGTYGNSTSVPSINVRPDGRLDAATDIQIAIPHTQITDFTEAVHDVVGELVINSDSINTEYDDYSNTLKFHVNEEHLITTNVSNNENQRAPTSQAIKQYVDDNVEALNTQINNVYNAITAHRETINLSPSMLTQEIPLNVMQSSQIMPNSVVAFIDRIGIFEGLDFTIDDNSENQVVLMFTPSILNILDGSEVLRISYLTKI